MEPIPHHKPRQPHRPSVLGLRPIQATALVHATAPMQQASGNLQAASAELTSRITHHASRTLNIALVHDYLNQYGGAERVLEALHALYPNAPVYTSIYAPKLMPAHFRRWTIRTSF